MAALRPRATPRPHARGAASRRASSSRLDGDRTSDAVSTCSSGSDFSPVGSTAGLGRVNKRGTYPSRRGDSPATTGEPAYPNRRGRSGRASRRTSYAALVEAAEVLPAALTFRLRESTTTAQSATRRPRGSSVSVVKAPSASFSACRAFVPSTCSRRRSSLERSLSYLLLHASGTTSHYPAEAPQIVTGRAPAISCLGRGRSTG